MPHLYCICSLKNQTWFQNNIDWGLVAVKKMFTYLFNPIVYNLIVDWTYSQGLFDYVKGNPDVGNICLNLFHLNLVSKHCGIPSAKISSHKPRTLTLPLQPQPMFCISTRGPALWNLPQKNATLCRQHLPAAFAPEVLGVTSEDFLPRNWANQSIPAAAQLHLSWPRL